ncbi:MAG: hypothetical protein ABR559_02525 [Gemmatimonadota bacterium]
MSRRAPVMLLLLLLAVPAVAPAQHQVSVGLDIAVPQKDFAENTDTGYGVAASYLYALHPSRALSIGVTGAFLSYGSTQRRVGLSSSIPDIRVDVETSNNNGYVQAVLAIKAPTKIVQPYVQANGGYGWFYTTTSLKNPLNNETVLTSTNQSDGTWVWGGGGGIQVRVYEAKPEGESLSAYERADAPVRRREPLRVYADLGVQYLRGGEVEYLKEGSLVTDDGEYDPDPRLARSEIDALQYIIGVTFEF